MTNELFDDIWSYLLCQQFELLTLGKDVQWVTTMHTTQTLVGSYTHTSSLENILYSLDSCLHILNGICKLSISPAVNSTADST